MKNLFEYINDSNVNLFLETLDADIHYQSINESIQSSILMDFIKQITSMRNEQKERGDWRISTPLFKDMFRWRHIAWDKVKDSDFEICKHLQGDESDKKLVKARKDMEKKVRQVIKVESNAIVILRSPKTEKFTYYIDETGSMYQVSDGRRLSASRSGRDISQSERMYYVQENDIYYLPVKELSTDSKRADRYKSREGMIDFDKDSLRKIAQDNVRRYKEIIAKNKSQRMTENDTIAEEVQEMVNRVLELTIKYNKDIVKYADLSYKIEDLMCMIYDQQVHTGFHQGKSTYRGQNGLLYYFAKYMDYKRSALKDTKVSTYSSNSHNNEYLTLYKSNIEKKLEKIDIKINEIESLMV
jgi:hypothetical protein